MRRILRRLDEASRGDLLRRSRYQSKARWQKRLNYRISDFRGVDLKELFNNGTFVYNTPIKDYVCTIAFDGALDAIKKAVKNTSSVKQITLNQIAKALVWAYNNEDVRINCTCKDYFYRFRYNSTQGKYQHGQGENRPTKITNPLNNKGSCCKHLDLLLANESWIGKCASVITEFIKAYPDKAAYYLYDNPNERKKKSFDEYDKDKEVPEDNEDTLELKEPDETVEIETEEN